MLWFLSCEMSLERLWRNRCSKKVFPSTLHSTPHHLRPGHNVIIALFRAFHSTLALPSSWFSRQFSVNNLSMFYVVWDSLLPLGNPREGTCCEPAADWSHGMLGLWHQAQYSRATTKLLQSGEDTHNIRRQVTARWHILVAYAYRHGSRWW